MQNITTAMSLLVILFNVFYVDFYFTVGGPPFSSSIVLHQNKYSTLLLQNEKLIKKPYLQVLSLAMYLKRIRDSLTLANAFALISIVCTFYLLFLVVVNFAVVRPTSTSKERVDIDSSNFPDVVACLDPPYNNKALERFGYLPWTYYRGGSKDGFFIGWNGLNGTHDSAQIMDEILNLAVDEDLIGDIFFKDKKGKRQDVKAESRMLLYPQGRCLVIKPPAEEIESFKFLYLMSIKTDIVNQTVKPAIVKVFLMDPINDPLIYPIDLQMRGDQIKVLLDKKSSWYHFIIRVSRSYHVEGDPLFDCKEYSQEDTFGDCVHQEMKGIFEEKLNCTPPGLLKRSEEMCNVSFDKTKEESAEITQLFWNHYYNFESSSCRAPCSQTTYDVRLNSVADYDKLGVKLTFEPIVHVTRSVFSYSMVDFLTSLGGSVSILIFEAF